MFSTYPLSQVCLLLKDVFCQTWIYKNDALALDLPFSFVFTAWFWLYVYMVRVAICKIKSSSLAPWSFSSFLLAEPGPFDDVPNGIYGSPVVWKCLRTGRSTHELISTPLDARLVAHDVSLVKLQH